jgi:hypothetical protein
MNKLFGFLKWSFGTPVEWIKNPYFYSTLIVWTGLAITVISGSRIGLYTTLAGISIALVAFMVEMIRFQYRCYIREQQQIAKELSKQ